MSGVLTELMSPTVLIAGNLVDRVLRVRFSAGETSYLCNPSGPTEELTGELTGEEASQDTQCPRRAEQQGYSLVTRLSRSIDPSGPRAFQTKRGAVALPVEAF